MTRKEQRQIIAEQIDTIANEAEAAGEAEICTCCHALAAAIYAESDKTLADTILPFVREELIRVQALKKQYLVLRN